jgi:hypothetical protein
MFKDYIPGDSDSDSDSDVMSTDAALSEEDNEYPIKELIADKFCKQRAEKVYLVHWEGYTIDRATWEPRASFEGDKIRIIQEYHERKAAGKVEYFDWEKWDADREREDQEREERGRRRADKRNGKLRKGMILNAPQLSPSSAAVAATAATTAAAARKGKGVSVNANARQKEAGAGATAATTAAPTAAKGKGRVRGVAASKKRINDRSLGSSKSPALDGFVVSDNSGLEEESDQLASLDDEDFRGSGVERRSLRRRKDREPPVILLSSDSDEDSENSGPDGDSNGDKSLMDSLGFRAEDVRTVETQAESGQKSPGRQSRRAVTRSRKRRPAKPSGSPPRTRIKSATTAATTSSTAAASTTSASTAAAPSTSTSTAATTTAAAATTAGASSSSKPPLVTNLKPTGGSKFFSKLSIRNAVYKKGKSDRAPPANELDLINLSTGGGTVARGGATGGRTLTGIGGGGGGRGGGGRGGGGGGEEAESASSIALPETDNHLQDAGATAERNMSSPSVVQKRKRSPSPTRPPGLGLGVLGHVGLEESLAATIGPSIRDQPLPPSKRRLSELDAGTSLFNFNLLNFLNLPGRPSPCFTPADAQENTPLAYLPAHTPLPTRDIAAAPPVPLPLLSSPPWEPAPLSPLGPFSSPGQPAADGQLTPFDDSRSDAMETVSAPPAAFCCEVEYGPTVNTMKSIGTVKFAGFSSNFLLMLHSLGLEKLWISKSLETSYIARYFVPVSEPF